MKQADLEEMERCVECHGNETRCMKHAAWAKGEKLVDLVPLLPFPMHVQRSSYVWKKQSEDKTVATFC